MLSNLNNQFDELLKRNVEVYGNRDIFEGDSGEIVSHVQLDKRTSVFSKNIKIFKKSKETFTAILMPHSIVGAVTIISLLRSGLKGLVIGPQSSNSDLLNIVDNLPVDSFLVLKKDKSRMTKIFSVYEIDEISFYDEKEEIVLFQIRQKKMNPIQENISWMILTSGSTGKSKGVCFSLEGLLESCKDEIEYLEMTKECSSLSSLIYSHDVGFHQLLSSILVGAKIFIYPFIFPQKVFSFLKKETCTKIWGSPFLWRKLLGLAEDKEVISEKIDLLTVSGGSLTKKELENLQKKFPYAVICKTYGQTETFRSLYGKGADIYFDSIPRGVELQLLSKKDGVGELAHFGVGAMKGFWQDQRWFKNDSKYVCTGDYFSSKGKGLLKFEGRKDDMLKVFDQRFFALEVERVLLLNFLILEAYVFFSKKTGLLFAYCLTQEDNIDKLKEDLYFECRKHLSLYKVPADYLFFKKFPRLENGKIDKIKLRALV